MAKANPELIAALRRASFRISKEDNYQWGHMGHCNCGHLAQELSNLSPSEIHKIAMQRSGNWNDQCQDYCSDSKMPIDILISELLGNGLSIEDLMDLEKLSNPKVLEAMKGIKKYPERNNKKDVALYMNTWADVLEEEFLENTTSEVIENQLINSRDKANFIIP